MQYTSWKGKEGQLFFGFEKMKKKKKKKLKNFFMSQLESPKTRIAHWQNKVC